MPSSRAFAKLTPDLRPWTGIRIIQPIKVLQSCEVVLLAAKSHVMRLGGDLNEVGVLSKPLSVTLVVID